MVDGVWCQSNALRASIAASVNVPTECFRYVKPPGTEVAGDDGLIDVTVAVLPTYAVRVHGSCCALTACQLTPCPPCRGWWPQVPAEEVTRRLLEFGAASALMAGPTFSVRSVARAGEDPVTPVDSGGDGQEVTPESSGGGGGYSSTDVVIGLGIMCAAVAAIGGG